jgi:AcrR family transcriptional regulator
VSSIYHHFGSLEQLLVTAQERAIATARNWCAAQLESLAVVTVPPQALGGLLAGLIDDWCHDQRATAFAWRECRLKAARHPAFAPLARTWTGLWDDFWATLCGHLSIPQHAAMTARFFTGESGFHLIPWNRLVDRATLGEACAGWSDWLGGQLSRPAPWREWARAQAAAELAAPPLRDATEERIATAAAELVEQHGVAGLTYRAVAADAGVTLGVVSHKFRTSADLIAAAFEVIYRHGGGRRADELVHLPAVPSATVAHELAVGILGETLGSMGSDELLLACARNPALRTFAGTLRYSRGRTSGHYLGAMLGPAHTTHHVDAAIFSSFLAGILNAHGLIEDRAQRVARGEAELAQLLTVFGNEGDDAPRR